MARSGGDGGPRPRRRSGAKARKTKYLSLSRHLAPAPPSPAPPSPAPASLPSTPPPPASPPDSGGGGGKQHLELFQPHPEPNVDSSTLFAAAPSLTDILGCSAAAAADESSSSASAARGEASPRPQEEEDLARRALRGRERWVYCRSPLTATAATSSSCSSAASAGSTAASGGGAAALLLKLDYDEILAAWSGRGSLYIGGADAAQVVPELDPVFVEVGGAPGGAAAWSVPEMGEKGKEREERVRRYKEKRQSRLFAKRIRYEVRKRNAEKRPRLKGRFIKANGDVEIIEDSGLQPA